MTTLHLNIQNCPMRMTFTTDEETALRAGLTDKASFCSETHKGILVTVTPPKKGNHTPTAVCNLLENGTCPFLQSKEH